MRIVIAIICVICSLAVRAQSICSDADIEKSAAIALEGAQALADSGEAENAVGLLQVAVAQLAVCDLPASRTAANRLDYESALLLADMPDGGFKAMHSLQRIFDRIEISPKPSDKKVWAQALALRGTLQVGASQFDQAMATYLKVGRMFGNDSDSDVAAVAVETGAALVWQLVGLKRCQEAQAVVQEFKESRAWSVEPFIRISALSASLAAGCQ